jgi:hypothetical protein
MFFFEYSLWPCGQKASKWRKTETFHRRKKNASKIKMFELKNVVDDPVGLGLHQTSCLSKKRMKFSKIVESEWP